MEKLFLSYTYRPHPAHQSELEKLHRCTVRAIEAMGLHIIDGVDVGGRPLDDALRQRIEDSDGLIALVTPQADDAGNVIDPAFVLSEFQYAEGQRKPTIRIIHQLLSSRGIGASNEYIPYRPGNEVDVILKLMTTISQWIRDFGRVARVRLEPDDLATKYDETTGDRCEYQVISPTGVYEDFQRASLRLEPGAAYAVLPKLREGERVRLRLRQNGKIWRSRYAIDPFVAGVRLEEQ